MKTNSTFYFLLFLIFEVSGVSAQSVYFKNNHISIGLKALKQNDSCYVIEEMVVNDSSKEILFHFQSFEYNGYALYNNTFYVPHTNSSEFDNWGQIVNPNDTIIRLHRACFENETNISFIDFYYAYITFEQLNETALFIKNYYLYYNKERDMYWLLDKDFKTKYSRFVSLRIDFSDSQ